MVPTAALATMMQTPRPPCSAPHRPAPGDRRGFRRPRTSRGPVACRVLAGWGSSGWAGIRRVGGPSAAARPVAPRPFGPPPPGPFGPLVPRPPGARPSQPASRPRGPGSRGSGTPRPASRRGARLAPGGTTLLPWPPVAPGLPWPPGAGLPWPPAPTRSIRPMQRDRSAAGRPNRITSRSNRPAGATASIFMARSTSKPDRPG